MGQYHRSLKLSCLSGQGLRDEVSHSKFIPMFKFMYSYSVHTYLTTCIAKPQLDKYVTFNITKIYSSGSGILYTINISSNRCSEIVLYNMEYIRLLHVYSIYYYCLNYTRLVSY